MSSPIDWISDFWEKGHTPFHLEEVNPLLQNYYSHFNLVPSSRVFVPLCGKTRDLGFFADRGHLVFGVELSALAIESFFREQKLHYQKQVEALFTKYVSGNLALLRGDYFDLSKDFFGGLDFVYDRASLIALPHGLRKVYVERMLEGLSVGAKIFLISSEYDQNEMAGPPFSVPESEIQALFGETCSVELLERTERVMDEALEQRGLTSLTRAAYLIERTS